MVRSAGFPAPVDQCTEASEVGSFNALGRGVPEQGWAVLSHVECA